jgi:hypothetical protein
MTPTAIQRVEDVLGHGPYQYGAAKTLRYDEARVSTQPCPTADPGICPAWLKHFGEAEHKEARKRMLFGFAKDGEQLSDWFFEDEIVGMEVEGFCVEEFMAVRVLHGAAQVCFDNTTRI